MLLTHWLSGLVSRRRRSSRKEASGLVSRRSLRSPRRRKALGDPGQLGGLVQMAEHFEDRTLLAATVYVDDVFNIDVDQGVPGLDAGDEVTFAFGEAGETSGLIFGTDAFSDLPSALAAVDAAGQINVATGTFIHSGQLDIDQAVTITGAGQDLTIIQRAGSVTGKEERTVQLNAPDITIEKLTLGGWENAPTNPNVGFGYLAWLNDNGATFDDVRFDADDNRVAIYVGTFDDLTVTDSRFTGTYFRAAIRGAGENMLISRNVFEESHYWYSPIYFEYGGATSGEISYNYFANRVGVNNQVYGNFKSDGTGLYAITNFQPNKTTVAGLEIAHNTFHFQDSALVNGDGAQPIPTAVYIDPLLPASGPITVRDNIFQGYQYTGPQASTDPLWHPAGGKFGGALEFDGVDDFGVFKSPLFDVGTAGTLSFWVMMDDTARRNQFFEGPQNSGLEVQYRTNSGGQVYGRATTVGGDFVIRSGPDGATLNGNWANIQITYDFAGLPAGDGGGKMRVYIDGVESSYLAGSTPTDLTWGAVVSTIDQVMSVGRDPGDTARAFDGKMDDIGWFNAPLSAADRATVRTSGVGALAADPRLVAHWDFDQAAGDIAVDNKNSIPMTIVTNGISPFGPEFRPGLGKFGGALEFDGVDDFGTFQDPSFDVGEKGTINFWVKMDDTGRRNQFLEGPDNSNFEVQFRTNSSGQVYGRVTGDGDFVIRSGPDGATLNGNWSNIQIVYDFNGLAPIDGGGNMRIYINGSESTYLAGFTPTDLSWAGITSTVNQLMNIGRDPGDVTRHFDGMMDDFAWFDDVLLGTERLDLRDNGLAASALNGDPRLVAHWNFDDAPGTTVVPGDGGTAIQLYLNDLPTSGGKIEGHAVNASAGVVVTNNIFHENDVDFNALVNDLGDNIFANPNLALFGAVPDPFYQIGFGSPAAYASTEFGFDPGTDSPHIGAYQGPPGKFGMGDLLVNGGDGDDILELFMTGPDSGTANFTFDLDGPNETIVTGIVLTDITGVFFNAGKGDDRLIIHNLAGSPFNPVNGIEYNAGTGGEANGIGNPDGDALEILGGTATSVEHVFTNNNDGFVHYDGSMTANITYTGLEPVTDTITATDRIFTFTGGAETITLTDAAGANMTIDSTLGESVTFANPSGLLTINAGTGNDIVTITSVDADGPFNASLTINGGTENDTVNLNADITFAAGNNLDVDLQNDDMTPGTDTILVQVGANLVFSGLGSATLKASRTVALADNSSIAVVDGDLTIEANLQGIPTVGTFQGIEVNFASLETTGIGDILLKGRGGDDALSDGHFGVAILNSSISSSAMGASAGTITIEGTGGNGTNHNYGVYLSGISTDVTSVDGDIEITGTGVGTGISNFGVYLNGIETISSTGTGADAAQSTIHGTGGNGTTDNHGVYLFGATTDVTSVDGDISITGIGQGTGGAGRGVFMESGADIVSTGTGASAAMITITGTGASGGSFNTGIRIEDFGTTVSSVDGNIKFDGTGGASTAGGQVGVEIVNQSRVESTGTGADAATITILGQGGTSSTQGPNYGVQISSAEVASIDGDIFITGTGGAGTTNQQGVLISGAGIVESTGTGADAANIDIDGTGGAGTDKGRGVQIEGAGTFVRAKDGDISIAGTAGSSGTNRQGVYILSSATVRTTGDGNIDIDGTGAGGSGDGVLLDATIDATGTGKIDVSSFDHVTMTSAGLIASASGNITVTADTKAGNNGGAILMADGALMKSTSGQIDLLADGKITLGGLTTSGNVTVTTTSGSILDGGDTHADIIAADANLSARDDIGAPGTGQIDVDVNTLTAATTLTPNPGTHGIWIGDSDDITLTSVKTNDGVIVITSNGDMTATSVIAGGPSRGVSLKTTAGDIKLGSAEALGDRVHLDAFGSILDTDGDNDVNAAELTMLAGSGIGTGNAIDSTVAKVAATALAGGVFLTNTGGLTIASLGALPGPFPAVSGVTAAGDIVITALSPLTVDAHTKSSGGNILLTATDSGGAGDDLVVKTLIDVEATVGNVTLRAGDDLTLEDSSDVIAGGQATLLGDFGDADPGVGSTISIFGSVLSGMQALAQGAGDDDHIIVDPGMGHQVQGIKLDGTGGSDLYTVQFGRLAGTVAVEDSGIGGKDHAILIGLADDETFNIDGQMGGTVENATEMELVTYTASLELLTVRGEDGNDTFTGKNGVGGVEPSFSTTITVDGGSPGFGPGPGDYPQVAGDQLILDPLGNTFDLLGKTIFVDGDGDFAGAGPGDYKGINFRRIESLPLLPMGTDTLRFDFDAGSKITQSGYQSVAPGQLYGVDGNTYGWNTTAAAHAFDRDTVPFTTQYEDLVRDGHWDIAARTFTTDIADGWYLVSVKFGDVIPRDQFIVANADNGQVLLNKVSTPADQYASRTFVVQVTDGTLDLTFSDTGGPGSIYWGIDGLEIRPGEILTIGSPDLNAPLAADGVTIDEFFGFNATPNSLVTISGMLDADGDTFGDQPLLITSVDQDTQLDGIQVLADGTGKYAYHVQRPDGRGTAYIGMEEFSGDQTGCLAFEYEAPEVRRFDFNHGASPTQTPVNGFPAGPTTSPDGYIGVLTSDKFGTGTGYGWLTSPQFSADRDTLSDASPQLALRRDLHYGLGGAGARTFRMELEPNQSYIVNVTIGDVVPRDQIRIQANGSTVATGVGAPAGQYRTTTFEVAIGGAGLLDLNFDDLGGIDSYWSVNGIEVRPAPLTGVTFTTALGTVDGDGLTVDTINGIGPANTLLTITHGLGTVVSADANSIYAGHQVLTDGAGNFSLQVQRPHVSGTPTYRAVTLDGEIGGESNTVVTYEASVLLQFDMNQNGSSQTQAGHTAVIPTTVYSSGLGYGWVGGAPLGLDRGVLAGTAFSHLLRDANYHTGGAGQRTFQIDLAPSTPYTVTVAMGDAILARDNMQVFANNVLMLADVDSAAGQLTHRSFTAMTDAMGQLQLRFNDNGGSDSYWSVAGVTVREASNVLTVTHVAGSKTADGTSLDTYQVSGATPGQLLTLSTTAGKVTGVADADPRYAGVQIVAPAATFTFDVQAPAAPAIVTISAEEVFGQSLGSGVATYTAQPVRRFDFNTNVSPTAAGFIGVSNSLAFNPVNGHGWSGSLPFGVDRGSASKATVALYRDVAWGNPGVSGSRTFRVAVDIGTQYDLQVYTGDAALARDQLQVSVEGGAFVAVSMPTAINAFTTVTLLGVGDQNADGYLDINFSDIGGTSPYWSVNGLDLATSGAGLPGVAPLTFSGTAGSGATAVTATQVQSTLDAAVARMVQAGFNADLFRNVRIQIADLDDRGTLGLAGESLIVIDDDGLGHGWFLDATPFDDDEFDLFDGEFRATDAPAAGRVDLLTVLMHELGHIAGLGHDEAGLGLMTETLGLSTRRLPNA